jgi:hypothetical protein
MRSLMRTNSTVRSRSASRRTSLSGEMQPPASGNRQRHDQPHSTRPSNPLRIGAEHPTYALAAPVVENDEPVSPKRSGPFVSARSTFDEDVKTARPRRAGADPAPSSGSLSHPVRLTALAGSEIATAQDSHEQESRPRGSRRVRCTRSPGDNPFTERVAIEDTRKAGLPDSGYRPGSEFSNESLFIAWPSPSAGPNARPDARTAPTGLLIVPAVTGIRLA